MSGIASCLNVSFKQMRAFVAIAECGSFTAASVQINSTQSSLSIMIRELEESLGVRLLDRTTRKVELTDAGEDFLLHARRVMAEVEQAVVSVSELAARKRGRVVVAMPPIMAATLLPPILRLYHKEYPNIAITVEDIPPDALVKRVTAGLIDCGVGMFNLGLEGVNIQPLIEERQLVIFPKGHPLGKQEQVRWADLRDLPMIGISKGTDIRREIDSQLRMVEIFEPPIIEVHQMLTLLGLVSAGLGVAAWPSWAVGFLEVFGVESRPLIKPITKLQISAITPMSRNLSPAAQAFVAILTEGLKPFEAANGDSIPSILCQMAPNSGQSTGE